jgi:lipid-binding SYLF domain-containing protein
MKTRSILLTALAVAIVLLPSHQAVAGYAEESKVDTATEVLTEIIAIPEKSIPPSLLRNAHGIAVIPGVIKAGFVIGGRYGKGIMVVRSEGNRWSNPSFVTIAGGSIGWQIGAQSIDVILVFKTQKSIYGVTRRKFTLGVDAEIAAGPVGRHAEVATDVQLKAEIYSYSRSRGLFAGIAIEGAALSMDHDSNEDFYGKLDIRPGDIFEGKVPKVPAEAAKFKQTLNKASREAEKD